MNQNNQQKQHQWIPAAPDIHELEQVKDNYKRIMYQINDAIAKYRKSTDIVKLMAVTKTAHPDKINTAIDCGVQLLGENRVQEYLAKKDMYKKSSVHFIGNLQVNKVKYIIDNVDMIQSVGSIKLLEEINKRAKTSNKIMDVLIEINIGNEELKGGIEPDTLSDFLDSVEDYKNICIKGLMAIPPKFANKDIYEKLQKLFIDNSTKKMDNINISILSVGMTNDFTTAIEYGSNIVRIGTGLFGRRNYLEGT